MVKSWLDPAAALASKSLCLSLSTCWIGSRSELQTEKSGLCGADGWDVMGWDWKGGAVAHWLPPVDIGMTTPQP